MHWTEPACTHAATEFPLPSVLQRVSVWRGLPPDRLQHHSDMRQVSSVLLEPGERRAGQEAGAVWGKATRPVPRSITKRNNSWFVGPNSINGAMCGGCELMLCWSARCRSQWINTFLLVSAETREAQVCAVCDICRKWKHHHWRLEWEHSGVGKRHVNEFRTLLCSSSVKGDQSEATFRNAVKLIPALPTFSWSAYLSPCLLICPLQAVDPSAWPTQPPHPSHPISVTQALIASATSSKELTRAASLPCACWGMARCCLEEKTAGSSPGTAATSRYRQWRWERLSRNFVCFKIGRKGSVKMSQGQRLELLFLKRV